MANVSGCKRFKDMTMAELKDYLRERGVSVSGHLKPALIEIANAVEKMMLPTDPHFKKATNVDGKLIIHDMEIADPLSGSHKVVNNFIDSPPFGLYDIFNYLIYHSTDYDKQGLAAYKSFDDYRLFQDGYVESLLTKTLTSEGVHLYLGKVRPAMKDKTDEGKNFYDLWFIVEGNGVNRGSVLKARCTCKGGRDGGCKHIAAAMYSLEDLLNSRDEDSVTSGPCPWVKRPTSDSKPCEVKDLKIRHASPLKRKPKNGHVCLKGKRSRRSNLPKIEHVFCENIDLDVRHEQDRSAPTHESLSLFTQSVSAKFVKKPPTILPLLNKKYGPRESDDEQPPWKDHVENQIEDVGIMKTKLLEYTNKSGIHGVLADIDDESLFTTDDVEKISSATVKQWRCREWYINKSGFISASKAKTIFGTQCKIDKGLKKDTSKLVEEIVNPKVPSHLPSVPDQPQNPRDWGLKHEDSARLAYYRVESKHHQKLKLLSKGFLISSKKPFIGASVDNIRTCACEECVEAVVEYKCPWKHRDKPPKEAFLTPEVGGQQHGSIFSLKHGSKYYLQVQLQMFVCNLLLSYLVVWTKLGVFVTEVPFDSLFIQSVVDKLQIFWTAHVLPFMLQQLTELEWKKDRNDQSPRKNINYTSPTKIIKVQKAKVHQKDNPLAPPTETRCVYVGGLNIYQKCIDGLLPGSMVNDNVVELLIWELCCHFPVISSFFYTVLSGGQETNQKFSRNERIARAETFFKPEMLLEEYIFIPINRHYHWLLAAITPWNIIIMDSLTWDVTTRKNEISLIFSYLEHLTDKFSLPKKHHQLTYKVLKVPQQQPTSNNCGIHVAMFLEHFLKELDIYESNVGDYCVKVHTWFKHEDAEKKRTDTRSYLQNMMTLRRHQN